MDIPILICLWIIQGSIAAYYAKRKGRNPYLWFAIGCFFGIFGIFAVFFLKSPPKKAPVPSKTVTSESLARKSLPYRLWYYLDENEQQIGPISTSALEDAWEQKKISLATYVWHEGMENWKRWEEICRENGVALEIPLQTPTT
jgi:hypothetical protein